MEQCDTIRIEGLLCTTRIGITSEERRHPQTLVLDLRLETDLRAAGASDGMADTIDYRAVAESVRRLTGNREFHLVEAVAQAVCDLVLMRHPQVESVSVLVRKHPESMREMVSSVGVEIHRSRIEAHPRPDGEPENV